MHRISSVVAVYYASLFDNSLLVLTAFLTMVLTLIAIPPLFPVGLYIYVPYYFSSKLSLLLVTLRVLSSRKQDAFFRSVPPASLRLLRPTQLKATNSYPLLSDKTFLGFLLILI